MLSINEATLEMHFHSALMDLFRSTFGLGPTGTVEFFKYSPQLERFVGFDQAYVRTELTDQQLYKLLQSSASQNGYNLNLRIYGYFLQFKVVKRRLKFSRSTPAGFTTPYFRSDLSTHRKRANDPSQHELLYRLAQNPGAMVYYACPMIFDRTDLYRPEADLDQLTLADMVSAPGPFVDNESHTLCYQQTTSQPTWCSDPVAGKGVTGEQFVDQLRGRFQSPEQLRANAGWLRTFLTSREYVENWKEEDILQLIGDALTIVMVRERNEASPTSQSAA